MTGKYGPNTAQVEAYLAILPTLTKEQWSDARVAASSRNAWVDAWAATWIAVCRSALITPWRAARDAVRDVVRDVGEDVSHGAAVSTARVAQTLVVRDLITREQFDTLTAPMRAAGIDFDTLGVAS